MSYPFFNPLLFHSWVMITETMCHHQYAHLPFPVTHISVLLDSPGLSHLFITSPVSSPSLFSAAALIVQCRYFARVLILCLSSFMSVPY
jgi:hypothetical protein